MASRQDTRIVKGTEITAAQRTPPENEKFISYYTSKFVVIGMYIQMKICAEEIIQPFPLYNAGIIISSWSYFTCHKLFENLSFKK